MSEYIKPRPKLPNKKNPVAETEQYALCRRLEEYIEFAHATQHFSDVGFYEELLNYIESKQQK